MEAGMGPERPLRRPHPTRRRSRATLDWLEPNAPSFAADYEGKLADLDAAGLLDCVQRYEKIDTIAGRIMSFAGPALLPADDRCRARQVHVRHAGQDHHLHHAAGVLQRWSSTGSRTTALRADGRERRSRALQARLRPDARDEALPALRRAGEIPARPIHRRGDRLERLFDETIAGLSFDVDGESAGHRIHAQPADRPGPRQARGRRARAGRNFGENVLPLFARVHNTLAKEKEIEDRWRKLPTPQTGRHLANHVEPEVVEALRNAVVAAYPR
jgi:oligoendopeptidase F